MTDYLRNQGHPWNHKRSRRVYRAMAMHLKRKPKKRLPTRTAQPLVVPEQRNQTWSLDFMSDALSNGRTFRTLNVLDDYVYDYDLLATETLLTMQVGESKPVHMSPTMETWFTYERKPDTQMSDHTAQTYENL